MIRDHLSSNQEVYLVYKMEAAFEQDEHVRLVGGRVRSTGQIDGSVFSAVTRLGHVRSPMGLNPVCKIRVGKPQKRSENQSRSSRCFGERAGRSLCKRAAKPQFLPFRMRRPNI